MCLVIKIYTMEAEVHRYVESKVICNHDNYISVLYNIMGRTHPTHNTLLTPSEPEKAWLE